MTTSTDDKRLRKLIRMTKLIPRKYRASEAELMLKKWPAYRFLSPMDATKLFHTAYVEGYKQYYRTNIDCGLAEEIKIGVKLQFYSQNAHLTQLWTARQQADLIGLPYPAYIEFCFEFASRRTRIHAPQPNQLRANDKTRQAWLAKFEDFWMNERRDLEVRQMEPMLQYSIDHDLDLPAQCRFREELVAFEEQSCRSFKNFVGRHVLELRQLRISDCLPLGEEAIIEAEAAARGEQRDGFFEQHEYEKPDPGDLYQSCFGLPGINTDEEPVCNLCPHFEDCAVTRSQVVECVVADTGFAEPIDEKRKKDTRMRVARHRLRQKLAASNDAFAATVTHPS